MKKVTFSFFSSLPLVFLILIFFVACTHYGFFWGQFGENDVDERSPRLNDFNSLAPDLASQKPQVSSVYSVLLFTDVHYGSKREDIDEKAFLSWLESYFEANYLSSPEKLPRFALNLGDTADSGLRKEFEDYVRFENRVKALAGKYLYGEEEDLEPGERKFRIYSILGNHDLYHDGSPHFEELLFPFKSSYYFSIDADSNPETGAFSFYFLDTANGCTGTSQLDDFKEKIEKDTNPKIVCTHYPVYAGGTNLFMILQNTLERNTLLTYFAENNVRLVFEGHAHSNYGFSYGSRFREDVIGSLRFSSRDEKQCAIFTVNESEGKITTEIIKAVW